MAGNLGIPLLSEDKEGFALLRKIAFFFILLFVLASFISVPGPPLFVATFTQGDTSVLKPLSPSSSLLLSPPRISWREPSLLDPLGRPPVTLSLAGSPWFAPSKGRGFLPVITVWNSDVGSIDLIFTGATWTRISVPAYSQRVFTLPPGWYEVELWPQIGQPLRGTALFLPYHRYRAETRVRTLPPGAVPRPFHLGD